jgi:hypothetical protein
MKKFVFIYYGKTMPKDVSPEQMKQMMDAWMVWFGTFKNQMVDGGNPFGDGAKSVTASGVETITSEKWPATGYTIINAKDMDEATKIAQGCPALKDVDGAVRVYEAMPM